ncbi:MAG: hypothetical protein RLY23_1569 [Actinomycetota bacterium]
MAGGDVRRLAVSSSPKLTPDEIASRSFAKAVRGVSEAEVRSFLSRVAEEVAAISEREDSLRSRIESLEEQLRSPKAPTDQELLTALGEETARVLRSAQSAAEDIRTRSEERAAAILKDAEEQSKTMSDAAEEAATTQVNSANEISSALIAAAEETSAAIQSGAASAATANLETAERDAAEVRERARIESESEIEQARQTGREMLAEAKAVRERVLADLARRRELLTSQIEELRIGRDRLLGAYRVVKQTLADATSALGQVDSRGASALATSAPFVDLGIDGDSEENLAQVTDAAPETPFLEASNGDAPNLNAPNLNRVVISTTPNAPAQSGDEAPRSDPPNSPASGRGLRRRVRESLGITEDSKPVTGTRTTEAVTETLSKSVTESVTVVVTDDGLQEVTTQEVIIRDEVTLTEIESPASTVNRGSAGGSNGDLAEAADAPEVESIFARLRADGATSPLGSEKAAASATQVGPDSGDINSATETELGDSADDERSICEAVLLPLRRDAIKRAKRALQDDQNALLERLRTQKGRIDLAAILGDGAEQTATWVALLSEPFSKAFIGAHTGLTTEPAPKVPEELVSGPVGEIVGGLRSRLSAVIAANDSPDSDDSISRAVGSCFRDARGQGLEAALGDALSAAWSRGVYEAVATGTLLRWVPIEAGRCSDCDDNALEPTPRGQNFPTGQAYPPAHPGCRCLITPDASLG